MKEVIVFAVLMFALFQVFQTEPREVVRTIEKPVYVEKQIVVKEPQIVEKTTERIIVVKEAQPVDYRQPINYNQPRARAYYATYETPYREERRKKATKETEEVVDVDWVCDLKKPNFFGVENLCSDWRKQHGYDY